LNIQIFGKSKCFDTKKAERFFKERKIRFQYTDIIQYGLSKGELKSVIAAVGIAALVDEKSAEYERLHLQYLVNDDIEERLIENPGMYKTPVVRNGRKATVGHKPEIWKEWIDLNERNNPKAKVKK
jgi:arsenate reductase-like glutaredoxin family protein